MSMLYPLVLVAALHAAEGFLLHAEVTFAPSEPVRYATEAVLTRMYVDGDASLRAIIDVPGYQVDELNDDMADRIAYALVYDDGQRLVHVLQFDVYMMNDEDIMQVRAYAVLVHVIFSRTGAPPVDGKVVTLLLV